VIAPRITDSGVTKQEVVDWVPAALVTVRVKVLVAVMAPLATGVPLVAEAVTSNDPAPVEPIMPVPPEKVGVRFTLRHRAGRSGWAPARPPARG